MSEVNNNNTEITENQEVSAKEVRISEKEADSFLAERMQGNDKTEKTVDLEPNATYIVDGEKIKTDDNGDIYSRGGKLLPNITYELNGNKYVTDENGRIVSTEAHPTLAPENTRESVAQKNVGGHDRRENDQGGHIVGRDMNGDGGEGNLVAMDSRVNQSDYKRMENDIKASCEEGKEVRMKSTFQYEADSERPSRIDVEVTTNDEKTIYKFDNDLDNSLLDDVPEEGKDTVKEILDDTKGVISSIKETYDSEGNLKETVVNITYTNEEGTNSRTKAVIEH